MGLSILSSVVMAGEKGEKKGKPTVGKLEVVKEGEAITAINIVGKNETVSVVVDDKSKEMAAAMEGKTVMIKGEKNEEGKFIVAEFKEKPAAKEKKAKKTEEAPKEEAPKEEAPAAE